MRTPDTGTDRESRKRIDMAVSSVGATDPSAVLGSAVQQSGAGQLGEQDFLKLLVTQLTNQDPLQPQDQSQFLAQLAQFSTVQGVNSISSGQDKVQAAGLLGKTVDAQVMTNNIPSAVSGQVSAVRYDSSGVHLQVGTNEITLDQVQRVRD
jgi:flagellar basal-body rod modification protein FlgD